MNDSLTSFFIFMMILASIFVTIMVTCQGSKNNVCENICLKQKHDSGRWNDEKQDCECIDIVVPKIEIMEIEK